MIKSTYTHTRRENLRALVAQFASQAEFCRRFGFDTAQLSQLLSPNASKNIGEKLARKIEEKTGMPAGFLDRTMETPPNNNSAAVSEFPYRAVGLVPTVAIEELAGIGAIESLMQSTTHKNWIPCPVEHSEHTLAVTVTGAALEPRFRAGHTLIFDFDLPADDGKLVLAQHSVSVPVVRQLIIDGHNRYLKTLNPAFPDAIIAVTEDWHILATAVAAIEPL